MEREAGGGSGWGTHVNSWLIHVNVWQKPLQLKKKHIFICYYILQRSQSKRKEGWTGGWTDGWMDGRTQAVNEGRGE